MNSYSKTFGYNIFPGGGGAFVAFPIIIGPFLAVFSSYMWMVLMMAYYFLLLAVGYWIRNHWNSLIIDQSGITLKSLRGNIKFVSWRDVGGFHRVTKGSGRSKMHGIGIVDANISSSVSLYEDYDEGPYIMFIETDYGNIADSEDTIIKAVEEGIDCYVHHKRITTHGFVDNEESQNLWKTGIGILLVFFAFTCVYFNYQYEIIHSSFYKELIEHSLTNGGNFTGSSISYTVRFFLVITGFLMFFFPKALMNRQFKHATGSLAASMVLLLTSYFLIIPDQKKIFDNCHDLNFQYADTITTVVDVQSGGKGVKYTSFHIVYGSTAYHVRTNYVNGIAKGMPMRIVVQKGSLNIPVVTAMEIRDINFQWKQNILGDTYNNLAYQYAKDGEMDRALKTINKAIATDSTDAYYYDSKGEFLLRNGDKDGAIRMWTKVTTLDPHFGDNNNSWLQKQLINLGIPTTSRLKETTHNNKELKNLKESTIHRDTTNMASKWTEKQFIINDRDLGYWTILESSSAEPIIRFDEYNKIDVGRKYSMVLAYQKQPARVLILVGEKNRNNPGEYTSIDPPMDKEVKVWFGQRKMFFHPKRCSDINSVYELNKSESFQFIKNINKKEDLSFVSVRKGSHVITVYNF